MKINQYYCFLFLIVLTIAISSCENDEDKNPTAAMVGSWKEVSIEYFDCPNASDNDLDECASTSTCETWQFNADGTFKRTTTSGIIVNGTYYSLGSNKISLCYTACTDQTISISGTTLTITEVTMGNECVRRYKLTRI